MLENRRALREEEPRLLSPREDHPVGPIWDQVTRSMTMVEPREREQEEAHLSLSSEEVPTTSRRMRRVAVVAQVPLDLASMVVQVSRHPSREPRSCTGRVAQGKTTALLALSSEQMDLRKVFPLAVVRERQIPDKVEPTGSLAAHMLVTPQAAVVL
jgi:hypothetical protein